LLYRESREFVEDQRKERRNLYGRDYAYEMQCALDDCNEFLAGGNAANFFEPKKLMKELEECVKKLKKEGLEFTEVADLEVYPGLMGAIAASKGRLLSANHKILQ